MSTLSLTVLRREPVLVGPASPTTPCEKKRLSDVDNQDELRSHIRGIFFYRGGGLARGDPGDIIRRALSEALVHYYPLAGRLLEVENRKLAVDCTGEGVTFIEADADVRMADLEADVPGLMPPFPWIEELCFEVDGSSAVLNCPLVIIQVTRLLCGGFAVWHSFNHTMCDAAGFIQFLNAVAELARVPERRRRARSSPTVAPAWSREVLDARSPPTPAFPHSEYDPVPRAQTPTEDDVVRRAFVFGLSDIAAIKEGLPPHLRDRATSFEVLAAVLWRARTASLRTLWSDEEARLVTVVSARRHSSALSLPAGYYGFACAYVTVVMAASTLLSCSLADVVEQVREAKASVTPEYMRSTADLLVLRGRPPLARANMFLLSDLRHVGFQRVDFGWGEPVYGGPSGVKFGSAFVAVKTSDGTDAVAVPVALPTMAMDSYREQTVSDSLCGAPRLVMMVAGGPEFMQSATLTNTGLG
ncbi:benzyl alcohol O-benzoyltransferase [Triticum aestivum]|uniref:benzyl alcohol O-benzoyltransferase n=1 Tax=Triticum aestivum TaxID=4565 RepID=UPI001D008E3B|nr:benzyl alcohol O-benzoyltransferase-like [Triticum aestivum]